MPWGSVLQALVNQAVKRSDYLQDRLEELQSKRFNNAQPSHFLIGILDNINKNIRRRLAKFTKEKLQTIIDYQTYLDNLDLAKVYANTIHDIYEYIFLIETSTVESSPPAIIPAIERIARELIPAKFHILICPSLRGQYEYKDLLRPMSNFPSDILNKNILKEIKYLIVLNYPFFLKHDVLCHACLLHELGHLFIIVNDLTEQAWKMIAKGIPPGTTPEQTDNFLNEYIADIFAVRLLGPAFLFALIEAASPMASPDQQTRDHPPLLLRIRNILDTLDTYNQRFTPFVKFDFAEKAEQFLDGLNQFTSLDNLLDKLDEKTPNPVEIYRYLEPALVWAKKEIGEKIPSSLHFSPKEKLFKTYIKRFVEQGIPPSAFRDRGEKSKKATPLSLGELLNAVWLYQVVELQNPGPLKPSVEKSEHAGKLRDLRRLTQLAIQQIEVLHLYENAKV
jgi:CRISPR/Cas system-associated endoribonuclease Cas2